MSQSFSYNDIGNILSSPIGNYSYASGCSPQPHAVASVGSRTYCHNAIGQMTSRNGTVINWNGDGKPSSIGSTTFVYDGLGERLKKTTGSQTTRYLGGDYEIASDGTITKYFQGGKQVGTQFFIHHRDHLGSIQSITNTSGVEVRGQKHKPFGDQFGVTGSHLETKGWIGAREEETELVYLNARYYDPEIGRFTAPDPILRPGQNLNRYAYSLNNPVSFLDPMGLDPECPSAELCTGHTETVYVQGELPPFVLGSSSARSEYPRGRYPGSKSPQERGPMPWKRESGPSPSPPPPPPPTPPPIEEEEPPVDKQEDEPKNKSDHESDAGEAVNWWGEFFTAIPDSVVAEFGEGGCASLFLEATGNALLPFTPSAATAAEPLAIVWGIQTYNATVQHAASRGLTYPLRSSIVRANLHAAKVRAASGPALGVTVAVWQGLIVEMHALNQGSCR